MKTTRFILPIAAAAFFLATWWLAAHPAGVWNSPDEMANAFWSSRVADGLPAEVHDEAVSLGEGAVHPRSFAVRGDALVPGSFPGLFLLYGTLHRVLRMPFELMTPLLTALASLALYASWKRLFDRRAALVAAGLFLLHPAVLYYSARGMFHNVLFVDLVALGAASFVARPWSRLFRSRPAFDDLLGGALLGAAVAVRASEAVWLVPAAAAFLPHAGRERWRRLGWAAAGAALPIFLLLIFNARAYGHPLATGYAAPRAEAEVSASGAAPDDVEPESAPLLPFGVHPRNMLRHGWDYGLASFWWFALPAAVGFALFLFGARKASGPSRTYAAMTVAVSAWLLTLYGSWYLRDHVDPSRVTIGTSYVRYFLPAYVLTLPWAAQALLRLTERVGARRDLALAASFVVIAGLSLRVAVVSGDESLLAVRRTLAGNAVKKPLLLEAFPEEAAIMTARFDKLVFPERLRILPRDDQASFAAAVTLSRSMPVYWYGLVPSDEELLALEDRAWRYGFELIEGPSPIAGEVSYLLLPVMVDGGDIE